MLLIVLSLAACVIVLIVLLKARPNIFVFRLLEAVFGVRGYHRERW
jgi:hypothetical protein